MARSTARQSDFIPHLPDLILSIAECWRMVRDAQTEVDPFGRSFEALGEARASLESLAYHCTGQTGFLALAAVDKPEMSHPAEDRASTPF